MSDIKKQIVEAMPYGPEFLFVDEILEISENEVYGTYRFREDQYFYEHHFPGNPVTPGVILTECMAQIGLLGLGFYLHAQSGETELKGKIAFSSADVKFRAPVYPGMRVWVRATKEMFRMKKLVCKVEMTLEDGKTACKGTVSGMWIYDDL